MFLKNYTSDCPVHQTIQRIEQVLKEYGGTNGEISAITFRIHDQGKEFSVRVPANTKQALEALWRDYAGDDLQADGISMKWGSRKKQKRSDFVQQAERTAWKLMQDWVEVQMSMIQMKQAEPIEVFLPYVWDGQQTVFARFKEGGFAALPESTNSHPEPMEPANA